MKYYDTPIAGWMGGCSQFGFAEGLITGDRVMEFFSMGVILQWNLKISLIYNLTQRG